MNPLKWLFGEPTRDQFAQELMAEFRRAGETRKFEYDKDEFRLKTSDGGEVNLGNLFQEYSQMPRKDRKTRLRELVRGLLTAREDLPELLKDARPNLRPKIWTRATFAALELRQRLQGDKPVDSPLYPLGSHLVTTVVYDMPTSMRSLSKEDLEKWGISYYEAMEIACENLAESTSAHSKIGDGFYSAISGDSYDSSRILLKDQVLAWEVQGDHVAMIPQRDSMFVTGSDDETGLMIMYELTQMTLRDQPRPLAPIPLRFVDGEWEDWMLPKSHSLFNQFQELETNYLGELYGEQKKGLDAIHEREGIDIFVASFSGIRKEKTEPVTSYCVWSPGVDSMLPKTQLIVTGQANEPVAYEWDDIVTVAGHLMKPVLDLYPVRYRVTDAPTDEQLQKIQKFDFSSVN